jgi:hypothetical protein
MVCAASVDVKDVVRRCQTRTVPREQPLSSACLSLLTRGLLHHATTPQFATSTLWKLTVWFLRLGVLGKRTMTPLRTLRWASSSSKPWPRVQHFDALLLWVTSLRRNLSGTTAKKIAARYPTLSHVERRRDFGTVQSRPSQGSRWWMRSVSLQLDCKSSSLGKVPGTGFRRIEYCPWVR